MLLQTLFNVVPRRYSVEIRGRWNAVPDDHPDFMTKQHFVRTKSAQHWATKLDEIGRDVYFGVALRKPATNKRDNRSGGKQAFGQTSALWSDCDHQDAATLARYLPPTFVVDSGSGFHVYYMLTEPLTDPDITDHLLKVVAGAIDGDPAAAECAHVLRVPGTHNYKASPKEVQIVTHNPHAVYEPGDFIAMSRLSAGMRSQLLRAPEKGERSEKDWALINDLVKAGLSDRAIEAIYLYRPCGDKARENPEYLPHSLSRARAKITPVQIDITPDGKVHKSTATTKSSIEVVNVNNPNPSSRKKLRSAVVEPDDEDGEETGLYIEGFEQFPSWQMAVGPDAYYGIGKEGAMQPVSTFVFDVVAMHQSTDPAEEDLMVVDVKANGYTWPNFVIPTSAFHTAGSLKKALPRMGWAFPGTDRHATCIADILVQQWIAKGHPSVTTTSLVGRQILRDHRGEVRDVYVTSKGAAEASDLSTPVTDIIFRPSGREQPEITLFTGHLNPEQIQAVVTNLSKLNTIGVMAPAVGWFAATSLKPVLREAGHRFPHFMLYGSRGAGKTTLVGMLQRLVGYSSLNAQTWPANTTAFVLMGLLGSTQSVPICLTEFREGNTPKNRQFGEQLRVAYDNGQDARGRPDQTTVTYPLTAPVCLDGEHALADPALKERTLITYLDIQTLNRLLREETHVLEDARRLPYEQFGVMLMQYAHTVDVSELYVKCMALVADVYDGRVPSRVMHNFAVALMGLQMLQDFCELHGVTSPWPVDKRLLHMYFGNIMSTLVDENTGRTRQEVDEFVEAVINHCLYALNTEAPSPVEFRYFPSRDGQTFGIHMSSAHRWATREGMQLPPINTLRKQLNERMHEEAAPEPGNYFIGPRNAMTTRTNRVVNLWWIDLELAAEAGLDIGVFAGEDDTQPAQGGFSVRIKKTAQEGA